MIKTDMGTTKIKVANECMMIADYGCITLSVVDVLVKKGRTEEEAWEEINRAIEMAKTPEDELIDRAKKGIVDLLAKLFGDLKEKMNEKEEADE